MTSISIWEGYYFPEGNNQIGMRIDHLDFRSLECFVAVAEELNFAKAARRLNLSQPPLTKRIQLLEEQLSVSLFERTTRSVRLTPAGSVLLREARRLFEHSMAMQRAVQHVDQSSAGTLRIGFINSAFLSIILPNLPKLTARLGSVEYVWSELTAPEQVLAVRNMQLDLAFVHTPIDYRGLHSRVLLKERFVAAMSISHRLANRPAIRLQDLADETFGFFPREVAPDYHDMFLAACNRAGFAPRIQHHPRHFLGLLTIPACGCGVSLVPASAGLSISGLKLVPVRSNALRSELMMLWNPVNTAPMLRRALSESRTIFGKRP